MANLSRWWGGPSVLTLQRDVEDVMEDFAAPRWIRRELERVFDEFQSPGAIWREMDRLLDTVESPPGLWSRLSRLFEGFTGGIERGESLRFAPHLDVAERDNEYVMKVDLPGMREKDLDIRVSDDAITISGERREEERKQIRGYKYHERSYGSFSRTVALPPGIDSSKIMADFRNGVLEVKLPKTDAGKTRRIPVGTREEQRAMPAGNGPGAQASQGAGANPS